MGLGAFRALAHWAHTLVTTHRPAAAGDLALPQDEVGDRFDEAELSTRAAAVADAYAAATTRLEAAVSDASPDPQQLTDALWAAADLGVDGSVPRTMTDDGPASVDALLAQAQSVATGMTTMSTRAADVDGGSNRLKALLGQAFPVLPRFTVADPEPLRKSLTARTTLCAGDDLAPGAWLRADGTGPRGRRAVRSGPGRRRAAAQRRRAARPRRAPAAARHRRPLAGPAVRPGSGRPAGRRRAHQRHRRRRGRRSAGCSSTRGPRPSPDGRRRPASRSTTTHRAPALRRPSCSPSRPR